MITTDMKTSAVNSLSLFTQIAAESHEQVAFCYDADTGLRAIIAIHSTVLGPSLGGTRMWPYASDQEALHDVLRLSRGMTLKAAITGLNLGGGKAVIIGDSRTAKSEALWRRYGQFVDGLNGRYITAEDVGTSTKDLEYIAMETRHCAGLPEHLNGGGDPSPVTAYGTYLGMKAAANEVWGKDSLSKKKVLVQGIGHVGTSLVELLVKDGAEVLVSDIREDKLSDITRKFKVTAVKPDDVYDADMDIYAPCALGATLNDDTIPALKAFIVAGAANNQLKDEDRHGEMLRDRGILYAPDFLINAGGLINCYAELDGYDRNRAMATCENIYDRTIEIFERARQQGITTHQAAEDLAMQRVNAIAKLNTRM
jgi:leucine dehydrogenase